MEQQFQRWTAERKAELILELIKGTKNLVEPGTELTSRRLCCRLHLFFLDRKRNLVK